MRKCKDISLIKREIVNKITTVFNHPDFSEVLGIKNKKDNTIVTDIDIYISELFEKMCSSDESLSDYTFFSEESYGSLKFPAVILDPIDGTKELAEAIPECCVSLAIMESEKVGSGWIFNPFTGFEISTDCDYFYSDKRHNKTSLLGYVSQTEFSKGLFDKYLDNDSISIYPKGSIALKLGLLAAGSSDFVVTKVPKNIWDIAAGTLLCWSRNINLYQNGNKIDSLGEVRLDGTLIWCREDDLNRLNVFFD